MYSITSKAIATGVIALTLIAASPVFADTGNANDEGGLHLGIFAKVLHEDQKDDRNDNREARKDSPENAASSSGARNQFAIEGTVTFMSGTTLTVQGRHGAVYTVNASNASVVGHNNTAGTIASIALSDTVQVKGTLMNNVIIASKIRDTSDRDAKTARAFKAGIVTAINGAMITLSNFGSNGTTSVMTTTGTKYNVNGSTASSGALAIGSHVFVFGTANATSSNSVNASIIVILTEGLNWIKHFWK